MRWGAALHMLRTAEALLPGSLLKFFNDDRPTVLYTVPSTLNRVAAFRSLAAQTFPSLRALIFAGESPNVVALRKLRSIFPNATFHHWYGSTEAALVTAAAFAPGADLPDPLPIGKVVRNVELAIRTTTSTVGPITAGVVGELLVASTLLFEGYYGDPSATRGAFLHQDQAALAERPRAWFCTNDVVRCDDGQTFFYVARNDRVLKIRGNRVDLDDISARLRRHAAVEDCVVVAQHDAVAGARIFAFYTGDAQCAGELKELLKRDVPAYMVPDAITWLAALPTTASGKVDHARLLDALTDHIRV
jgi:acyl-coenzyme A synthetase/AMP-(fatty) acid ligase